jgi:hypothetical protein
MSSRLTMASLAFGAGILLGLPARADQWDLGADPDNGPGTDNAPFHGAEQVHDLGALPGPAPDQDWYIAHTDRYSSYEFLVYGQTGDVDFLNSSIQLVNAQGNAEQTSVLTESFVRSLTFQRGALAGHEIFIRVRNLGTGCGIGCTGADTYRVRFYDTTYTIPRFNNSGTQSTALLIQNNTRRSCRMNIFYFNVEGDVLTGTNSIQIAPLGLEVVPLAGGVDRSGSARVAHECGYGSLSGKAVSIEPATGLTFDTPMLPRPR